MDTAVRILCDVAGADSSASDLIVDRSLPVLTQVMGRREIDDMVCRSSRARGKFKTVLSKFPRFSEGEGVQAGGQHRRGLRKAAVGPGVERRSRLRSKERTRRIP